MLSHVHVGTNDFDASFGFYAPLMAALGCLLKFSDPARQWAGWRKPGSERPLFLLGRAFDGQTASAGNGQMVALLADSHAQVEHVHGLAMGMGAGEAGAPGFRPEYHPHYYGAYFRDLDGNKIGVACHDPAGALRVRRDDLSSDPARQLVAMHLEGARANSPPGNFFALDVAALLGADVQFFTAWDGEKIAGMAALRSLPEKAGEVKSMRTHPDYLRRGVGRRLLAHVVAEAAAQGMTRLSLETGSGPAFEPALAMYRHLGFRQGAAFGNYPDAGFSQFFHMAL